MHCDSDFKQRQEMPWVIKNGSSKYACVKKGYMIGGETPSMIRESQFQMLLTKKIPWHNKKELLAVSWCANLQKSSTKTGK